MSQVLYASEGLTTRWCIGQLEGGTRCQGEEGFTLPSRVFVVCHEKTDLKVVVIPKGEWARAAAPILLSV